MRARGYTLLEALVAVALLAILSTLAQAAYLDHLVRARRSDATTGLLRLAQAQEDFYLTYRTYAGDAYAPPPDGLGLAGTDNGWYRLEMRRADETGFLAAAVARPESSQARDGDCVELSLDQAGRRGSTPAGPELCWR